MSPAKVAVGGFIAATLLFTGSFALAQTLACNPQAPRTDPGTGFVAFGANEQALARGGNAGPAWEWALGTDTETGQKVQGSLDWVSGRTYSWTLTYSGSGSAALEVRDQGTLVLSLNYPSGMDAGNGLQLQVATNPSIGAGTTIAAAVTSLKGHAVSGSIAQTGNNQESSQQLHFYFPAMAEGFAAQGTVTLTYATLPTGSRVDFRLRAGTLPCTNLAPAVSITAPAAASLHQAGTPISISANAADTDGTVVQVEFLANGAVIGTDTSAPFSFDWTNATPGAHSLTARATDNAGDRTTSSAVSITVNAQPTVSITSPASGTVVQAPGAVILDATAADSDGTISKVDFYQGGTLVGTDTTSPYSFALSNLAAGTYSFTAVATDDRSGVTTSAAVSVVVNAAPTANLTSPAPNAVFTAPANIPITAEVTDTDGTISSVDFYFGTTLIATRTAPPYSVVWTGVPQGAYSLTARATDNNGATVTSSAVNITVNSGVAKLHFIHTDHLNTPRLVANQQGQTVWRWDQQEPFGVNVPDENPSGLGAFEFPLRFPGQYFDKETNLHYNYFRDYDSGVGRYVQSDPIGMLGGPNTYLYVRAKPLSRSDPTGLRECPLVADVLFWAKQKKGKGVEGYMLCIYRCEVKACPGVSYLVFRWGWYDLPDGCDDPIYDG